jgi:hypothetical protein
MSNYPIAYVDILLPGGKAAKGPAKPARSVTIKGDLKLRASIPGVIKQKKNQTLVVQKPVNIRFVLPVNSGLTWSSVELWQNDPGGDEREGNWNMPIRDRQLLDPLTMEVVNHYRDHDDGTTYAWKMVLWFRRNGMLVCIDPDVQNSDQDRR